MPDYSAVFNCPGCGSPLEILEGTISLRCPYCGLILRVGSPGRVLKYFYDTSLDDFAARFVAEGYLKKNGLSLKFRKVNSQLYHLPFYRFRGMSYALFSEAVSGEDQYPDYSTSSKKRVFQQKCRPYDLTIPAFGDVSFGLESLGIRPQVVPLAVFSKESFPEKSLAVDITVAPEQAEENAMRLFFYNLGWASMNKEYLCSEMIGEGLAVIYYPVWAYSIDQENEESTLFIDGLNKRVYHRIPCMLEYHASGSDRSRASALNPVQHKCPNCGFDLPVSESSLFYHCSNCGRSYLIKEEGYFKTEMKSAIHERGEHYHPFWRFAFSLSDGTDTVSGFSRILTGEIPLIAKSKAENPFYLYVPAFKAANLGALTNLGVGLCRVQPELEVERGLFSPTAEMVLPETEAKELARFYWNVMRCRYQYLNSSGYEFKSCKTSPGELIWLSFARPHYDSRPGRVKKASVYA